MKKDDELELTLNPHRAEERAAATLETAARLRSRGIAATGHEDSEDLVDLLTAVERFEEAVEAHGGDLMVDDLKSSEPDDPQFVVPRREQGESLRGYAQRIEAAAAALQKHPAGG
jgi:thymidine phosphorylase